MSSSRIQPLVRELNDFCMSNRIIGIHYTRADKARIEKQGLLLRSGEDIRETFIQEYGKHFTDKEIAEIASRWDDCFCDEQTRYRDFCVFFNFTEDALSNGGAEYLLKLYGGEQISMCFRDNDCPIGKKLGQIGEPLLVRCSLDPKIVNTFTENPWGKILVSSFHVEVNSEAYRIDQDGYIKEPVSAQNIIGVNVLTDNSS